MRKKSKQLIKNDHERYIRNSKKGDNTIHKMRYNQKIEDDPVNICNLFREYFDSVFISNNNPHPSFNKTSPTAAIHVQEKYVLEA